MPDLVQARQVEDELVVNWDGSSNESGVSSLRHDGNVVVVAVFQLIESKEKKEMEGSQE